MEELVKDKIFTVLLWKELTFNEISASISKYEYFTTLSDNFLIQNYELAILRDCHDVHFSPLEKEWF